MKNVKKDLIYFWKHTDHSYLLRAVKSLMKMGFSYSRAKAEVIKILPGLRDTFDGEMTYARIGESMGWQDNTDYIQQEKEK